jgi:hypothetical protein
MLVAAFHAGQGPVDSSEWFVAKVADGSSAVDLALEVVSGPSENPEPVGRLPIHPLSGAFDLLRCALAPC